MNEQPSGESQQPFDPDDAVVLLTTASSFEASIIAAKLNDAGIEAHALTTLEDIYSPLSLTAAKPGVPVMVRRGDAARAQEHLERIREEATGVDFLEQEAEQPAKSAPAEVAQPGWVWAKWGFYALILLALLLAIWQAASRMS